MAANEKEKPKTTDPNATPKPDATNTNSAGTDEGKWGYDLYPERKKLFQKTWTEVLTMKKGKEEYDKINCEKNVYQCVKKSPLVKLMINALRKSGCPIDIRRNISCETCDESVTGGYDPLTNQVVICQNSAKKPGLVQGILTHEFIHMFDYCVNNLDFKNIEHLACTEIRAANLAHCSFFSAIVQTDADYFNVRKKHQDCVKTKAMQSIVAARDISPSDAITIVEKVFPKCYADLEPIGRRLRRNSMDMERAFLESYYYGYD